MTFGIGHNGGPSLRDYQEEAVQALFDFYDSPRPLDSKGIPVRKNALICLPTGTGKSLVIAEFIRRAMFVYPNTRAMMLTHVKELISQNAHKMQEAWPLAPLGIYSAGLNSRNTVQPIIFGGVKSVVNKYPIFGFRDFLIIDEAHLVGDDGMYLKVIEELMRKNPFLKVIGLSATPYRLGMGELTNGPIFTDVVYDLCNIDGFSRLIAQGYLCPLIPKPTKTQLDITGVSISSTGDFNEKQLQDAVDKNDITYAALCEFMEWWPHRNSAMIFASGIEHAEHIGQMLTNVFGVPNVVMHSKKTKTQNDEAMKAWKTGQVNVAISMNMLTTGVDHAPVDLIADLQPTMSTGKHVQKYGRGTRPYDFRDPIFAKPNFNYTKQNCLVLDFAGNVRRLGPINDPIIPRPKGKGPPGDAPVKICQDTNTVEGVGCGFYNHATAKVCTVCGATFKFQQKIEDTAYTGDILRSTLPQIEYFDVIRQVMTPHTSKAGIPQIQIAYFCKGLRTFYEWRNFEANKPMVRHKAKEWFRQRYHYQVPITDVAHVGIVHKDGVSEFDDVPDNNADVLRLAQQLRAPRRIKVWVNKPGHPEVMGYEF